MIVSKHSHKEIAEIARINLIAKFNLDCWVVRQSVGYAVVCDDHNYKQVFGTPKTILS